MRRLNWHLWSVCLTIVMSATLTHAGVERYTKPRTEGKQKVVIAYGATATEDFTGIHAFIVDGKRTEVPPKHTGFNAYFSAPRWVTNAEGKIVGLKFWEYDGNGKKRKVALSFPGYKIKGQGPWVSSPGTDTIEEPPK